MVKIAFVIYREWGYEIFKTIIAFQHQRKDFVLDTVILPPSAEFQISNSIKKQLHVYTVDPKNTAEIYELLKKHEIDIACFYSWSWIVRKPILTDFICLCLHPSPLPKYRGGTPIQHQIINGEEKSAVSIFKMAEGIDDGPLYNQTPISFMGDVHDIFNRMIDVGTIMTKQLLEDALTNKLSFTQQKNLDRYPAYKRRTPSQSEIEKIKLETMTYKELYNLVRGLLDPYPNAFITFGKQKIYILEVTKYNSLPANGMVLNEINKLVSPKRKKLFVQVKDGFAKILKYKID
jgi:methionyl-tRNA formyltransferase